MTRAKMRLSRLSLAALIVSAAALSPAFGQTSGTPLPGLPAFVRVAAPAAPTAIPLYSGLAPGSNAAIGDEIWDRMDDGQLVVRNVTRPTITPFLPAPGKATGAAVIVVPGGGFSFVAIENEGWKVARALAANGVTAFVLKYRPTETVADEKLFIRAVAKKFLSSPRGPDGRFVLTLDEPRANADVLRALALVRASAAKWRIDSKRVGLMGFSAGSVATMAAVRAPDPAARPDFFGYIYGPMGAAPVSADAPPMFAALAIDDTLFGGRGFGIVDSWHAAGRPVELHAYEKGDHGFGLGKPGTTTTLMLPQFVAWMKDRGLLTVQH